MTIIDAHAHLSDTEYGNVNVLLEYMDEAGVSKAILVPGGMIDVRKFSKYVRGEEKPITKKPANELIRQVIEEYPDKFYGFVCVDPNWGEYAINILEKYVNEYGFLGLKLAPMIHQFSFTGKNVQLLAEKCGELGIPLYTHTLYNPGASTIKLNLLAKKFPNTKIIIGHMGFGASDPDCIIVAKENPNVFLETSGASHLIIREAIREIGPDRIIFGSEAPMHHPAVELKKIEILKLKPSEKKKILFKNISKILRYKGGK